MDDRRDGLIDESVLRRALRLEAAERPPRFDPEMIASLARPRLTAAHVLGMLVLALAIGATATTFWWNALSTGPAFMGETISVTLDGVAFASSLLYPAVEAFSDPAVPLSLLVALGITIVYEMRTRREHAHAEAS